MAIYEDGSVAKIAFFFFFFRNVFRAKKSEKRTKQCVLIATIILKQYVKNERAV